MNQSSQAQIKLEEETLEMFKRLIAKVPSDTILSKIEISNRGASPRKTIGIVLDNGNYLLLNWYETKKESA